MDRAARQDPWKTLASMSFEPRFSISNGTASALAEIERARGFIEAAALSEDWLASMQSRALLLEAHHTTHIEGTRLTVEEAENLLAGRPVPGADPDDVRELRNYRKAFDFVSSYLEHGGPITERLILEIHRRLVEGVRGETAAPGEYRRVQNYVVNSASGKTIYTPPPPGSVPTLMGEFIVWLNRRSDIHPVIVSGIAQFQLVHIHPFLDGNGRTSRLLSTLCLYRSGYDIKRLFTISEYYDRDRLSFYQALQHVRRSNMDMTGWIEYFAIGLASQLSNVRERGELAIRRDILALRGQLSKRQALAVDFVLENGRIAIGDFQELCPDAHRRTLQRDLKLMVEHGLLIRHGSTNKVEYLPGQGVR